MLDGTVNSLTNAGLFTFSGGNNLNLKDTINNANTIALDPPAVASRGTLPPRLRDWG
jgi:hypothetical protein